MPCYKLPKRPWTGVGTSRPVTQRSNSESDWFNNWILRGIAAGSRRLTCPVDSYALRSATALHPRIATLELAPNEFSNTRNTRLYMGSLASRIPPLQYQSVMLCLWPLCRLCPNSNSVFLEKEASTVLVRQRSSYLPVLKDSRCYQVPYPSNKTPTLPGSLEWKSTSSCTTCRVSGSTLQTTVETSMLPTTQPALAIIERWLNAKMYLVINERSPFLKRSDGFVDQLVHHHPKHLEHTLDWCFLALSRKAGNMPVLLASHDPQSYNRLNTNEQRHFLDVSPNIFFLSSPQVL